MVNRPVFPTSSVENTEKTLSSGNKRKVHAIASNATSSSTLFNSNLTRMPAKRRFQRRNSKVGRMFFVISSKETSLEPKSQTFDMAMKSERAMKRLRIQSFRVLTSLDKFGLQMSSITEEGEDHDDEETSELK